MSGFPRRRQKSSFLRWGFSFFVAFVCLGFFLGLLVLGFNLSAKPSTLSPKPPPSSPFAYVPLSEQSWQKNRGDSPPLSLPSAQKPPSVLPPSPPKREPEKFFPNKQIVDVAPGNQQIDKNAEYIASTSNKVDKQTRARHSTAHYKNAAPQTTSTQKQQTHGQGEHGHISGNMGLGLDDRPLAEGTAARAGFEIPRIAAQSPLEVKPVPLSSGPHIPIRQEREAQQGNSERLVLGSHLGSYSAAESSLGHMGKKTGLALVPSYAALDKISGAAPNDHLADIEEGDGTFLSTREWKYASFFNRLKQSVGQHWHPNVVMQARDLNGQIYGSQDRYTLLSVKLHKSGRISHIQIAKSCGLHFLDEEAVAAFTRAAPFVNPPSNMFNGDEEIQFSFGFYLEISHGGLSGFLGRPRGGRLR